MFQDSETSPLDKMLVMFVLLIKQDCVHGIKAFRQPLNNILAWTRFRP